jgi:hypothetical protein
MFGTVYKGLWNGRTVAIKMTRCFETEVFREHVTVGLSATCSTSLNWA